LPHPDGPAARCASPMAKGYLTYFESGVLGSEGGEVYAREALEINAGCSYWISARDRISCQMVVQAAEVGAAGGADGTAASKGETGGKEEDSDLAFILPQIIPMGTITRRAVENTWLTAANAKSNRVGSELKSMITAPPGYCFVGADVDSQELWIASLVGDASFKLHGGNALGFMTLEGTKAAGTDLHSRTAAILGISRNDAKVFNYGRIYGAGVKFAQTLLRRFNTSLSEAEAEGIAKELYKQTKGVKIRGRKGLRGGAGFWCGGTESLVFNGLEGFAQEERPRTPVLGAGITEALRKRYLGGGGGSGGGGGAYKKEGGASSYLTSRINWAIQSSGVDYLHLLIVSMEYLTRRYGIHARLALTVHDEIRYLAREGDKYRCAMALQVANVWTRALFSQQMGIQDLPQACAYFSAVDVDFVLRKEVDMSCVTPSHPEAIAPGESLGIWELLAKGREAVLDPGVRGADVDVPRPERFGFEERVPVMEGLGGADGEESGRAWLRAQIAGGRGEVDRIVREAGAKGAGSVSVSGSGSGGARGKQVEKKEGSEPQAKIRRQRGKEVASSGRDSSEKMRFLPGEPRSRMGFVDPAPFDEWGLVRSMNHPQRDVGGPKAWTMGLGLVDHGKGWAMPGKVGMSAGVGRH
ncbi:DNA polymerase gamma, mitochondrial, partial [Friedmanniomyces simplex]